MKTAIFTLMLFFSFAFTKIEQKQSTSIVGTWCLTTNGINYPTITFGNDSLATLGSKMDTVYSYKYYMKNGKLCLILPNAMVNKINIVKLTKDTLILGGLIENTTKQIYYRCNRQ